LWIRFTTTNQSTIPCNIHKITSITLKSKKSKIKQKRNEIENADRKIESVPSSAPTEVHSGDGSECNWDDPSLARPYLCSIVRTKRRVKMEQSEKVWNPQNREWMVPMKSVWMKKLEWETGSDFWGFSL